MDRGAWWATVHRVAKSRTRLSDFTFTFMANTGFPGGSDGKESACNAGDLGSIPGRPWEDPLEKGTATHSSILAWRILLTEEPGRLQSMGSQRAGHD